MVPSGLDLVTLVGGGPDVTSYTVFDEYFVNGSEICRFDGATQGYGCAFRDGSGFVGGEEFPLREGQGYFVRTTASGSFPEDHQAPSLTIVSPEDSSQVYTQQPFLDVNFGDAGIGVEPGSFRCWLNGVEKTGSFAVDELGATWQLLGAEQVPEGANVLRASVRDQVGNEREVLATFTVVIAPPPPAAHFVNGYVFDGASWAPIEGAAVSIRDREGVVYTDAEGHYVFPTPGLGIYQIEITKAHYTYAHRELELTEGDGDAFVDDAFLTALDPVETRITPEGGGVAANSQGSIFTAFLPGTVMEPIDAVTTQFDEAEDLPKPLPELSVFTYCADFQPDGQLADTAFVDYLNHRGFSAGTRIPLGGYNPETMQWRHEGFAQVLPEPGWFAFGLEHFSPHDPNYPVRVPPGGGPDPDEGDEPDDKEDECPSHDSPVLGTVQLGSGEVRAEHSLPEVYGLGPGSLALTYASRTVLPQIVVESETPGVGSQFSLPLYTGVQLDVGGRRFTGIEEASRDTTRQRIRFDVTGPDGEPLPTGSYRFADFLSNFSYAEYATADSFGAPPGEGTGVWTDFPVGFTTYWWENLAVENRRASSLGSGWTTAGLQELSFRPDGNVFLTDGGAPSRFYRRTFSRPDPRSCRDERSDHM